MDTKIVGKSCSNDHKKLLQKSRESNKINNKIENEMVGNELIKLMELLQLPQNNDFADIEDNFVTECSVNDVTVILNNFLSELNPMKADDV